MDFVAPNNLERKGMLDTIIVNLCLHDSQFLFFHPFEIPSSIGTCYTQKFRMISG